VFFGAVSEKAEMTDTHEAIGQDMEEKAADEFLGIEGHRFQPVFVPSVAVPPEADQPRAETKTDLVVFEGQDTVIGQSHAVRVAAKVVKDRLWGPERFFGIDHPVLFTQRFKCLACGRDFSLVTGLC